MKKLKVLTVVGTRPEIIRLSQVLLKLDNSESIEHILVHTGQNYDYELNEVFFEDLGLRKPDYFLNAAGGNATVTSGQILINIDPILENVNPDAFLVLGDTNSCLCAIAAKKRKIPIFHMEAGNRCFDQRVPEETNRRIIDHTADVNLTYSTIAREYLLREGLPADLVIKIGSPMFEVLNHYRSSIDQSLILQQLNLKKNQYFLVSSHREENIEAPRSFENLVKTLNLVATEYGIPIIVSTHPRTKKILDEMELGKLNPYIKLLKPFGFCDYVKLQMEALCVISDSGTISEEGSLLNLPAITIRNAHERPEGMDEGTLIMSGLKKKNVLDAVRVIISQHNRSNRVMRPVEDYEAGPVSKQLLRVVLSYVDYVNRTVWSKN